MSPPEASVSVVTFVIGAARFALPAARVIAMRPLDEADGGHLRMEDLLGLPREAVATGRLLVLRAGEGEVVVAAPGEIGLRQIAASAIHPVPELAAARSSLRGLAALALDEDGVISIVEL